MAPRDGVARRPVDAAPRASEDRAAEALDVVISEAPTADETRWAGVLELLLAVKLPEDAA
jgi:hypothetical protein